MSQEPQLGQEEQEEQSQRSQQPLPHIIIYKNVLSTNHCNKIILACKKKGDYLEDTGYSVYSRYDFKCPSLSSSIKNKIPLKHISNVWAYTSYTTGGFIKSHVDGNQEINNYVTTHSLLLYLNDEYEGGELVIDNNIIIKPSVGMVIILRQDQLHHVNKITSGYRAMARVDIVL